MATSDVLDGLRKAREDRIAEAKAIVAKSAEENRDATPEEEAEVLSITADVEKRAAKIAELEKWEAEEAKAAEDRAKHENILPFKKPEVKVTKPETIYREHGNYGFFADVYSATKGDLGAMERLNRHNMAAANERPEYRSWAGGTTVTETRDGTTGATSFGSFIPPVWLLDEIAEKARTGRVVPNMVRDGGPPTSTSITIPRITTGTSTAIQTADNAALSETDIVTAQLTRTTSTIGGIQDASVQSIELSPMAVDRLIFSDLLADYNRALDSQTIIGTGTSGQLLGLDSLSGLNTVTYTDASPTVGELYPKIADAVQQVHTNRFQPPDAILMHPRRWGWFLGAVDTSGRPLVTPYAPQNSAAAFGGVQSFGPVGSLQGLNVFTSANIPTTVGAGTEDEIYVARFSDMLLLEGPMRTEVFRDVGSANATVRFRVYAFVNLFVGRFPAGVSQIRGTGLIAPTF